MQMVIELSEKIITGIAKEDFEMAREIVRAFQATIAEAIRNGTPLPKGHGRLKDTDNIMLDKFMHIYDGTIPHRYSVDFMEGYNAAIADAEAVIDEAPTIIEADKEEQNNDE